MDDNSMQGLHDDFSERFRPSGRVRFQKEDTKV